VFWRMSAHNRCPNLHSSGEGQTSVCHGKWLFTSSSPTQWWHCWWKAAENEYTEQWHSLITDRMQTIHAM